MTMDLLPLLYDSVFSHLKFSFPSYGRGKFLSQFTNFQILIWQLVDLQGCCTVPQFPALQCILAVLLNGGMNSSIGQNYEVILEKRVDGTACSCQCFSWTLLKMSLSSVHHPAGRQLEGILESRY